MAKMEPSLLSSQTIASLWLLNQNPFPPLRYLALLFERFPLVSEEVWPWLHYLLFWVDHRLFRRGWGARRPSWPGQSLWLERWPMVWYYPSLAASSLNLNFMAHDRFD